MSDLFFAFSLTLIAGLATALGGVVMMFAKVNNLKFLSVCLSFSAGVMIYISFAEIFVEALESLEEAYGNGTGLLIATVAFFAGIALMAIIDKFLPDDESHTELLAEAAAGGTPSSEKGELKRTGISSAIAISVHNFPEGLITFMAALYDPAMGIAIAIAIIIHNIPEGIAVAAPIYYSTGSKLKAFLASLGAGLTEPVGALIAWLLLRNVLDYDFEGVFGIIFAVIGGIMVFVSIHQLLPTAQKYGKHHLVMKWLFAGMAVMAVSLVILDFAF